MTCIRQEYDCSCAILEKEILESLNKNKVSIYAGVATMLDIIARNVERYRAYHPDIYDDLKNYINNFNETIQNVE